MLLAAKLPDMPDAQRPRTLLWILIGGGAFFLFTLLIFSLLYFSVRGNSSEFDIGGGEKIAVLDVDARLWAADRADRPLFLGGWEIA